MILAAAKCARDRSAPPPPDLQMAWQAASYHALPEVGGLLDQPAGLLSRMTCLYNVWFAHKAYYQRDLNKSEEWVRNNPDLFDRVMRTNRLRSSMEDSKHAKL